MVGEFDGSFFHKKGQQKRNLPAGWPADPISISTNRINLFLLSQNLVSRHAGPLSCCPLTLLILLIHFILILRAII